MISLASAKLSQSYVPTYYLFIPFMLECIKLPSVQTIVEKEKVIKIWPR